MKTVRHLLHLLSTSASKVRAHVLELLRTYYSLLFASAPGKIHETMVDFNRWLLEVLADTRSEGIVWGPSYGENPGLRWRSVSRSRKTRRSRKPSLSTLQIRFSCSGRRASTT